MLVGILSGCNLTSPSPLSRLPQIGREKPRVQQPTLKPGTREPISSSVNNRNLLLDNPSNAASSIASTDNYLMVKPQFVLSYNSKTKTANWVSWQLNKSWIGTADRQDNFRPDDALPALCVQSPPQRLHRPRLRPGTHCTRMPIAPATKRITALPF
jgi:endonuclease G